MPRVGEQMGLPQGVVRKAAAGQHHTTACPDGLRPQRAGHCGAGDVAALALQVPQHVALEAGHPGLQRRVQQATGQRVAAHQLRAAAMAKGVPAVVRDASQHVSQRPCRARGAQEVPQVGGQVEITFTDLGSIPYYCSIHGTKRRGQTGTIVVTAAS